MKKYRIHSSHMYTLSRACRFTLVEFLVVASILAVLSALLMPSLLNSVRFARDVSCMNQQRQVATAILSYASDSSGFLPANDVSGINLYFPSDNYTAVPGRIINSHYSGLGLLYANGYVRDTRILWCDNEDAPKKQHASMYSEGHARLAAAQPPAVPSGSVNSDYGYRCGWWGKEKNVTERLAQIRSPNDGLLLCVSVMAANRITWMELHQGRGCNLVFIDGSGVWYSYAQQLAPDFWGGNNYRIQDYPRTTLNYASKTARN